MMMISDKSVMQTGNKQVPFSFHLLYMKPIYVLYNGKVMLKKALFQSSAFLLQALLSMNKKVIVISDLSVR